MSSFTNITLNTKVYNPADIVSGSARWMEKSGGVGTSFAPLTLRVVPPAAGVKNYRVQSKMLVPVVADDNSTCACDGEFLRQIGGDISITVANGSTLAERQDFYERFKAWVGSTQFKAAVENLESASW